MKINIGIDINLQRLLETRLLVTAGSGAGKSWLLRKVAEEAIGKVQVILLDIEGEFATLREKYDYALVATEHGDIPLNLRYAETLAHKLLESGMSTIVDLYELKHSERITFVKRFLDAMINAPKQLWHSCLIIVDEAHQFCSEKGKEESKSAVIDLMTRGRKRGFCGVLASQRLSKLNKDAAAEAFNKLIGRTGLDIDRDRSGAELGMNKKEDILMLRNLPDGDFYSFGPAISNEIKLFHVSQVKTHHPVSGKKIISNPPTPAAIKSIISKLKDLPQEAEKEIKTKQDLQNKVRELQNELREEKRKAHEKSGQAGLKLSSMGQVINIQDQINKAVDAAKVDIRKQSNKWLEKIQSDYKKNLSIYKGFITKLRTLISGFKFPDEPEIKAVPALSADFKFQPISTQHLPKDYKVPSREGIRKKAIELQTQTEKASRIFNSNKADDIDDDNSNSLSGPEQRILNAIAWMESIGIMEPKQVAVAFLAGYTYGGGGFNNPRGALRTKGLVEYKGESIALTDEGREKAVYPETALTTETLHDKVLEVLPTPERRVLIPLLQAYPEGLSNDELAEKANYKAGTGGYNNPKGRLRSLGLIEYLPEGIVKAKELLFIE